jgi:membrane protease YdiL (CAAX protease family)
VLAATVAPAELVRVATSFDPRADRAVAARRARIGVPGSFAVVCALALGVAAAGGFAPRVLTSWTVTAPWLAAAVAVGCGSVALEYALVAAPAVARGARALRFGVATGPGGTGLGFMVSVLVTAVAEEVLYRGVWIGTLHERLDVPSTAAVAVAAAGYALGHMFFGFAVVGQKAVTGVLYGALLVASGSLLVPVVAHVAQNVAVSGLGARQSGTA